ncbi:MAG: isopeptide-forming domain-containing fimbrial protein [Clostridia bacterium]|nr:isopeptide-forming domain-containing fimbrial protein [Clostridia bacterium]
MKAKEDEDISGRNYVAYQILAGDVTGNILTNAKWGDGFKESDLKNVVVQAYQNINNKTDKLNQLTKDWSDLLGSQKKALAQPEHLAIVFEAYGSGNNADSQLWSLVTEYFAKLKAVKSTEVKWDESKKEYAASLPSGYYLLEDKSLPGTTDGYTVHDGYVLLLVRDSEETVVHVKIDKPTLTKEVEQEVNVSAYKDTNWQNATTGSVGDIVTFRLTADVKHDHYSEYKLIFTDKLSQGLTYVGNLKMMYRENGAQGTLHDLTQQNWATINSDYRPDTRTLTVEVSYRTFGAGQFSMKEIIVTYDAQINADAVVRESGNINEAYLEYSNNPAFDGMGKTEKAEAKVFVFELRVEKQDEEEKPLQGAVFELKRWDDNEKQFTTFNQLQTVDEEGKTVLVDSERMKNQTSGPNGKLVFSGLGAGIYQLTEVTAPPGYNLAPKPFLFKITWDSDKPDTPPKWDNVTRVDLGPKDTTPTEWDNLVGMPSSTITFTAGIKNQSGAVLPSTGGEGTEQLLKMGLCLIILGIGIDTLKHKRHRTR